MTDDKTFTQRELPNSDPTGDGSWSYEQTIPGQDDVFDTYNLDTSGFRDLAKEAGSTLTKQGYTVVSGADKPSKKGNGDD